VMSAVLVSPPARLGHPSHYNDHNQWFKTREVTRGLQRDPSLAPGYRHPVQIVVVDVPRSFTKSRMSVVPPIRLAGVEMFQSHTTDSCRGKAIEDSELEKLR